VVFFQSRRTPEYVEGQTLLGRLDPLAGVPVIFNQAKGSIPGAPRCRQCRVKLEIPAKPLSQKDLLASSQAGTLVRSMAHNMTVLQKYRGAMMDTHHRVREHAGHVGRRCRQRDGGHVEAQM
jgi:glucose/mannose transport system substrate-binding protein